MGDYISIRAAPVESMPSCYVRLYLSTEDARKELGDNYVLILPNHDFGAVSSIVDDVLIVLMDIENVLSDYESITNDSLSEILGYLAHESYHLAMAWMKYLGEDAPAEEEVAYHVGNISTSLISQFLDYLES